MKSNRQLFKWAFVALVILGIIISLFAINAEHEDRSDEWLLKKGIIDMSQWTGEHIDVKGEWAFYPGILNDERKDDSYYQGVTLPHEWDNEVLMNNDVRGRAVYVGTLHGLATGVAYGIDILDQVTSYRLWVNGKLIASNGNPKEHEAQWKPLLSAFTADSHGQAKFVMEVSNEEYHRGGFWNTVEIGHFDTIYNDHMAKVSSEIFLAAGIFLLGIFFLGSGIVYRQYQTSIWFSLFCLTTSLYTMLTGQRVLQYFINDLPWNILVRLEFLSGYLILPLFTLFIMNLFGGSKSKWSKWVIYVIIIVLMVSCLFTSHHHYSSMEGTYKYVALIMIIGVFIMMVRAIYYEHRSSVYMLIALAVGIVAISYEIWYSGARSLVPFATFVVVIAFSLVTIEEFKWLARWNRSLMHQANTDALTGLKNRQCIMEQIESYLSHQASSDAYIFFFDLDGFKAINDQHGHNVGDEVLKVIASRTLNIVGKIGLVSRYGGDEFVVLLDNVSAKMCQALAESLSQVLLKPIRVDDKTVSVGVSIGIVKYQHGFSASDWIHESDKAMYKVKKSDKTFLL